MSKKKSRKNDPASKIDPLHYAMYVDDNESIKNIEYKFGLIEAIQKSGEKDRETAARKAFIALATPYDLPENVWNDLEKWEDEDGDDEMFSSSTENDDDEGYEIFEETKSKYFRTQFRREKDVSRQNAMTLTSTVERVGEGMELWPYYRVKKYLLPPEGASHTSSFPRIRNIMTYEEIQNMKKSTVYKVKRINWDSLHHNFGCSINGIVMNIPFSGPRAWDKERFNKFIFDLGVNIYGNLYICIYTTIDTMQMIMDAFLATNFVFADLIVQETFDGIARPHVYNPRGVAQMHYGICLFRSTSTSVRQMSRAVTNKDIVSSTIIPGGRSDGGDSFGDAAHKIIENVFQVNQEKKLVFVDIYPSKFLTNTLWHGLDEK